MRSILIVNHGFLGDGMLASSLAENCKWNGYDRVDMLVGFPQLLWLLSGNPNIDNVYIDQIGSHPEVPKHILDNNYDDVYAIDHLVFKERPLDTFNKKVGLAGLQYDFKLHVPLADMEEDDKPRLAFQADWAARSHGPNGAQRDVARIANALSEKYVVYFVGGDTHYNIDHSTPATFLQHCALIQACDLFFGYPGGMHWVAGGVGTPTVCTSEHVVTHYTNNGEFTGSTFEEFCDQWMVHAGKHFNEPHLILEPYATDDFIIKYLTEDVYESVLQNK